MAGEIEQDRRRFLGAVLEPIPVAAFLLILQQRIVSGSPTGSPVTIETMLDCDNEVLIAPDTPSHEVSQYF